MGGKVKLVFEGILLFVICFMGLAEGFRLILYKEPNVLYDIIGPGFYILSLGIALMIACVIHIIVNYKKYPARETGGADKKMQIQAISMIAVCVIYLLLINILGYLMATIVFFVLEFRIAGVKSWRTNFILTLLLSTSYYVIFIKYLNVVFPRGILFK